jgi:hypothetical protein
MRERCMHANTLIYNTLMVLQVQAILKQHKQYSKLVSKMGKMGAIPKPQDSANNMATMQKVMQDPTSKASQAAISKLVNPQVLKQMGGVSGVTKAMQVLLIYARYYVLVT